MNRRNFITGLFGVGAVSVAGVANSATKASFSTSYSLQPTKPVMKLTSNNQELRRYTAQCDGGITIFPETDYAMTNKVEFGVGKDNRLWVSTDGQWKRVALEG